MDIATLVDVKVDECDKCMHKVVCALKKSYKELINKTKPSSDTLNFAIYINCKQYHNSTQIRNNTKSDLDQMLTR